MWSVSLQLIAHALSKVASSASCLKCHSYFRRLDMLAAPRSSSRFELQNELEAPEVLQGDVRKLHTACSCSCSTYPQTMVRMMSYRKMIPHFLYVFLQKCPETRVNIRSLHAITSKYTSIFRGENLVRSRNIYIYIRIYMNTVHYFSYSCKGSMRTAWAALWWSIWKTTQENGDLVCKASSAVGGELSCCCWDNTFKSNL